MTAVSPTIEQLKKEGELRPQVINQYTRYLTVFLAAFQGYGLAVGLEAMSGGGSAVIDPGWYFRIITVITIVGGTMFLMWLGEQITARGIGNGISLIIFTGIIASLPSRLRHAGTRPHRRDLDLPDHLPVHHVRRRDRVHRVHGARPATNPGPVSQAPGWATGCSGRSSSHLPLKMNVSGVIPPIFASSLLLMPATLANFWWGRGPEWLAQMTALLGAWSAAYLRSSVS